MAGYWDHVICIYKGIGNQNLLLQQGNEDKAILSQGLLVTSLYHCGWILLNRFYCSDTDLADVFQCSEKIQTTREFYCCERVE